MVRSSCLFRRPLSLINQHIKAENKSNRVKASALSAAFVLLFTCRGRTQPLWALAGRVTPSLCCFQTEAL